MNKITPIYFIYAALLVALYPVVEFELNKYTGGHQSVSYFSYVFRLFFSGPILILLGMVLVLAYKRTIHKIPGIVSAVIGIYWLTMILKDIYSEIRIF